MAPSAVVAPSAAVAPSAVVEPGAVVMAGAEVGPGCVVGANSVVGAGVRVGAHTVLGHGVSLSHCTVGAGCRLHSGVCVGADGFGFFVDERTGEVRKKPQERAVRIGDNVEIGANSCVDRGSWRDTVVGSNTKIDNLVQIGHNAVVGDGCFLCGHTALGGSSELGENVVLGGRAAVADHVKVAPGSRLAAKTGVAKTIATPGDYAGWPAVPAAEWRRGVAQARRDLKKRRASLARGLSASKSAEKGA